MARPPHEDPEYQRKIVSTLRYVQKKIYYFLIPMFLFLFFAFLNSIAFFFFFLFCSACTDIHRKRTKKINKTNYCGRYRQGLLSLSSSNSHMPLPISVGGGGGMTIPTSPLAHHNYTWAQQNVCIFFSSYFFFFLK